MLRCADAEILASASASVQRQVHADSRYRVLSAAMSAMYSVLSRTKNLQCERNDWCYELHRVDLYRTVS